ncbi:uncharacterized protein LOC141688117 [Apium graveolens]|uniref:uncharacterized protein LOC141688117 n=1 Tax=Apium graveolens TaxID=4045 RepID=UPI003D7BA34C
MAQLVDASKSSCSFKTPASTCSTSQAQTIPELLQADSSANQACLTSGKHNDLDAGDPAPNRKSRVLNKFRDTAKKLKSTLSSKRIRQSNIDSEYETGNKNETDNEDDDDKTVLSMEVNLDEDEIDEDPEYLGAPIYESAQAPEECKEYVKQHPREITASTEKHIIGSSAKIAEARDGQEPTRKTMTETVSEKLVPAACNVVCTATYAVSNATSAITSKISNLTVETTGSTDKTSNSSSGDASSGSGGQTHMYDKGVSVKEYLMQKLEPGEDEKALSQVIKDAISPKASDQVGMVVEKMKEAVNSYLQPSSDSATKASESSGQTNVSTDQMSSSKKSLTASKTFTTARDIPSKASKQNAIAAEAKSYSLPGKSSDPDKMKSKSCNATSNLKLSSFIPISTNSEEGTDTENHGRILQTN